jgi:hypothetical protein
MSGQQNQANELDGPNGVIELRVRTPGIHLRLLPCPASSIRHWLTFSALSLEIILILLVFILFSVVFIFLHTLEIIFYLIAYRFWIGLHWFLDYLYCYLTTPFQPQNLYSVQWDKISMLVFWVATSCGLVGRYQRFGGTYCLHFQGWWR